MFIFRYNKVTQCAVCCTSLCDVCLDITSFNVQKNVHEVHLKFIAVTITIAASLKFSEILAATFSATWLGLQERGPPI